MIEHNYALDPEEQAILEAFNAGELKSVSNVAQEKKRIQTIVKAHSKKLHRINIRLNSVDYLKAQEWALREGIPSATLLSSLVHKTLAQQAHT